MRQIQIRTLGTGAADYDWSRYGEPGIRGSTCTLVDHRILIDCGTSALRALDRFRIRRNGIDFLLITHSHSDHFVPKDIASLIASRGPDAKQLTVIASVQALKALLDETENFLPCPAVPGKEFDLGKGLNVTVLPANHPLDDPHEIPVHYLFNTPGGWFLYALDGAWMTHPARQIIGEKKLSMILWDATVVNGGDFRIFEHNDLDMISHMALTLRNMHVIVPETRIVLDHMARTLWPESEEACEKLAAERGFERAHDGQVFQL